MKNLAFVLMVSLVLPFFSGCFTTSSAAKKETKVDTAMSQGGLPDAPPAAGPGEPQKDFDQQAEPTR